MPVSTGKRLFHYNSTLAWQRLSWCQNETREKWINIDHGNHGINILIFYQILTPALMWWVPETQKWPVQKPDFVFLQTRVESIILMESIICRKVNITALFRKVPHAYWWHASWQECNHIFLSYTAIVVRHTGSTYAWKNACQSLPICSHMHF